MLDPNANQCVLGTTDKKDPEKRGKVDGRGHGAPLDASFQHDVEANWFYK